MSLRQHEIAEAYHRILDPLSEEKLRLLGEIVGARPGTRVLDLACGKGELLARWAEWFGTSGVGVDLSEVFLAAARDRVRELGVAGRVTLVQGDAARHDAEPSSFDVASCLGATWIGGGLAGTVELLRRAVHADGHILVGEPFWHEPPPPEALRAMDMAPGDYVSLPATVGRLEATGLDVVELVVSNTDDWDRYEAAQWRAIDDWLRANPDDPMHAEMAEVLARWRRTYLTWGRRFLGWAVFVTRPR